MRFQPDILHFNQCRLDKRDFGNDSHSQAMVAMVAMEETWLQLADVGAE